MLVVGKPPEVAEYLKERDRRAKTWGCLCGPGIEVTVDFREFGAGLLKVGENVALGDMCFAHREVVKVYVVYDQRPTSAHFDLSGEVEIGAGKLGQLPPLKLTVVKRLTRRDLARLAGGLLRAKLTDSKAGSAPLTQGFVFVRVMAGARLRLVRGAAVDLCPTRGLTLVSGFVVRYEMEKRAGPVAVNVLLGDLLERRRLTNSWQVAH